MPPIRAVLFDIGGPIDRETLHEQRVDAAIRAALAAHGVAADDAAYARAAAEAVRSHAPNAYQAILWHFLAPDAERARLAWRSLSGTAAPLEPQPGIAELLDALVASGLTLGLVANQPASMLARLDEAGLGGALAWRGVSGTLGLRKPDPRIFLAATEALGVAPEACIMVGDRIDNDIAPARLLGMRTVLFRTGRHAAQQARSWLELPDREVRDVAGLAGAIRALRATANCGGSRLPSSRA